MTRWKLPSLPLRFLFPKLNKGGSYVNVEYTVLTTRIIEVWSEAQSIPNLLAHDELHTSVLYSKVALKKEDQINVSEVQLKVRDWKFKPTGFDIFKSGDKNALVMLIDAPELTKLHQTAIAAGGTHDFDDYRPHVTLSYDVPDNYDVSALTVPPIYLVPKKITTVPLQYE